MRTIPAVGLVFLLLLPVSVRSQEPEIATLLLGGDPAPDGNGTVGGIGIPVINARGEVAVVLSFNGTINPAEDFSGVFLVDRESVIQLVRGGDSTPNGNGVFNYFAYDPNVFERVALNDNGAVAFIAQLTDTIGGDFDNSAIFVADATDGVEEYVRISDPAPDGNGTFGQRLGEVEPAFSGVGLDNQGQISFHSYLVDTSGGMLFDDTGIYRADGNNVIKLLRLGQPEPFGPDQIVGLDPTPASNSIAQVAMQALVGSSKDPQLTVPAGPPPPGPQSVIYVANEALLEQVFVSGGAPPDGNGSIGQMKRTRIAENGNLTFVGFVGGTTGDQNGRRLLFSDGVTLAEIARQNQLGPGETDFEFVDFVGLDSNNRDQVAFSVTLERNAVPPDNRTSAIYLWEDGNVRVVVHEGDPAPDGRGTFGDVAVAVFLNDRGQIAFSAEIEGAMPPPPGPVDIGIFVIDPDGTRHEVARSGHSLLGSTIDLPQFLGNYIDDQFYLGDADLRLAGMRGLNNAGQVAFWAQLEDLSGGLFLWGAEILFVDGFESGDTSAWPAVNQ